MSRNSPNNNITKSPTINNDTTKSPTINSNTNKYISKSYLLMRLGWFLFGFAIIFVSASLIYPYLFKHNTNIISLTKTEKQAKQEIGEEEYTEVFNMIVDPVMLNKVAAAHADNKITYAEFHKLKRFFLRYVLRSRIETMLRKTKHIND